MAVTDMTTDERVEFLRGVHIGILSIERNGKGPLALPIWYLYDDGDVVISMDGASLKAKLLKRAGRATMTVQDENPPYRYVMVEGPVTLQEPDLDVSVLAVRYLGPELGAQYAAQNESNAESVLVRLTPERWLTCDYGKAYS
jgi:PPOX class probable F420-dependent enzyme